MKITGAGSLPGKDFRGALKAMGELDELPWPELPARGVASSMIGHALGLIHELSFDLTPRGWRLTQHSDAQHRRAQAVWRQDLDDAEELLADYTGVLKIAVAGPWTLASQIEQPSGELILADHGARRDVAQALEEGIKQLASELARRLPHLSLRWQIDEPAICAVGEGAVRTASRLHRHRGVDLPELVSLMPKGDVMHCCAPCRWFDVAKNANYNAVYADARFVNIDDAGAWVDGGHTLILGVVDTSSLKPQTTDEIIDAARRVTREIGTERVWLAPSCGLAGWKQSDIMRQFTALRRAAELLAEG